MIGLYLQRWLFLTFLSILFLCCSAPRKAVEPPMPPTEAFAENDAPGNSALLLSLLQQLPDSLQAIVAHPEAFRVQIIYTQIDRDILNKPLFRHHFFNVDETYTYPASTIKLPAAVLSLEKLNALGIDGLGLHTPMYTTPLRPGEKPVFEDKSSKTGKPSIGHYIKKVLLVSDNDANNRMYEFLGQQQYNARLHALGFSRAQITHRLSLPLSDADNRLTNPIWFANNDGTVLYRQPYAKSEMAYTMREDSIGKAYMAGGGPGSPDARVNTPMDFSTKNRWPLAAAHLLTQWIMFPESQPDSNRLLLAASDYKFLWKYMSMLPGESDFPKYPAEKYWPAYVKFLWAGSEKGPWPDKNVRIFNKVGNAYGHLIDAAYIVDFDKKIEFMLSAVIYCNSNGVLNDDTYDYDTLGFPFMKALGQIVYQHELKRNRKFLPDLNRFLIDYNE
jgi:hypothetical protein